MTSKRYPSLDAVALWEEKETKWIVMGDGDSKIAAYTFGAKVVAADGRQLFGIPAATVEDGKLIAGSILLQRTVNDEGKWDIVSQFRPDDKKGIWYHDEKAGVAMLYIGKLMGSADGLNYFLVPAVGVVDGQLAVGFALQARIIGRSPFAVAVWWEGSQSPSWVNQGWLNFYGRFAERMLLRAEKILDDQD